MRFQRYSLTVLFILCAAYAACAQQREQNPSPTPAPEMKGMEMEAMNQRGDQVMGFDQTKTTHHFRLTETGGVIQVEANEASDTKSRDQIRMHLGHIARMFAEGNFKAPMLIHAQAPPGVSTMKSLKAEIEYKFEETERGARVIIKTSNQQALEAIQDFLRFQIEEHRTGDSSKIP
jgi:hypothetical protein